ncbi:MAG: extracellular solute-binding protein [Rhodospirillaceae bacterium]|nr:extracellular solute-binding protein [Rhodospirillaceae bacterium]
MTNPAIDLFRRARSRRDIVRGLRNLGLATVATTLPLARPRAAEEVTYYTWAGYDVPELHARYEAVRGTQLNFTLFADETEALLKIQSGFTPDISHPCIYDIQRWRDGGFIQPIDSARLPDWGNVFPALKEATGNAETGEQWLVPIDWGNGSVLYRTDLVEIEEESWSVLFDERYAGRLAMWDAIDGAMNAAALVSGAADPFNMTDAELAAAKALLVKQKDLLRFYWSDPAQAEQALASGEIVAAYTWNQSLVNLQAQGIPVKYMQPKEGILTWVCGLVMMTDGAADDGARYDFINAMLAPETGEWLISNYGYGHSNAKSFELAGAETAASMGLPADPAEMFANSVVLKPMDPAVRQKYIETLEAVKSGT